MHDRSEWTEGTTGDHRIGKRKYNNLTEYSRPCKTCGARFSIFVTKKIADGFADSNSFGLKNCEKHRRGGGTPKNVQENDTVNLVNTTMKKELEAVYRENAELRARMAKYELQPAMERAAQAHKMPWEA